MKVKVRSGQSVFDIAVIFTGDAVKAFDIAFDNGIKITDNIDDMELDIRECHIDQYNKVLIGYKRNKYEPSTYDVSIEVDEKKIAFEEAFDNKFDNTFN